MMTLMPGIAIRRLSHLEYPAFEKMTQNGTTITTAKTSHMKKCVGDAVGGT